MITNKDYIKEFISNNQEIDEYGDQALINVPYRWSHGATDDHLGDGLIIYSIIQHMRAKVCVCLGSGGGFIPRLMTQARYDLHKQGIFEGNADYNWGDIGTTYVVADSSDKNFNYIPKNIVINKNKSISINYIFIL